MTNEDKNLLLKALCEGLPYRVKVSILGGGPMELQACISSTIGWYFDIKDAPTDFGLDEIKPYLRPMSSMTEEEERELEETLQYTQYTLESYDWLNAHHFDYLGLIPMGLALEAKEGVYKTSGL